MKHVVPVLMDNYRQAKQYNELPLAKILRHGINAQKIIQDQISTKAKQHSDTIFNILRRYDLDKRSARFRNPNFTQDTIDSLWKLGARREGELMAALTAVSYETAGTMEVANELNKRCDLLEKYIANNCKLIISTQDAETQTPPCYVTAKYEKAQSNFPPEKEESLQQTRSIVSSYKSMRNRITDIKRKDGNGYSSLEVQEAYEIAAQSLLPDIKNNKEE